MVRAPAQLRTLSVTVTTPFTGLKTMPWKDHPLYDLVMWRLQHGKLATATAK
jgi:hypothetical protein